MFLIKNEGPITYMILETVQQAYFFKTQSIEKTTETSHRLPITNMELRQDRRNLSKSFAHGVMPRHEDICHNFMRSPFTECISISQTFENFVMSLFCTFLCTQQFYSIVFTSYLFYSLKLIYSVFTTFLSNVVVTKACKLICI